MASGRLFQVRGPAMAIYQHPEFLSRTNDGEERTNEPTNQPTNQPINQSINQSNNDRVVTQVLSW